MRIKSAVTVALALACIFPMTASAKKKKVQPRGMLESMQSVPCGAKQRGLAGVGSILGVGRRHSHVNSTRETLPAVSGFRTDDMDYEIRPATMKHPDCIANRHSGSGNQAQERSHGSEIARWRKDSDLRRRFLMQPASQGGAVSESAARPSWTAGTSTEHQRQRNIPDHG